MGPSQRTLKNIYFISKCANIGHILTHFEQNLKKKFRMCFMFKNLKDILLILKMNRSLQTFLYMIL